MTTSARRATATGCVVLDSPVGRLVVVAGAQGVRRVSWVDPRLAPARDGGRDSRADQLVDQALDQLTRYFAGARRDLDVALDLTAVAPGRGACSRRSGGSASAGP